MECRTISSEKLEIGIFQSPILITKFYELDSETQAIALRTIAEINKVTTTDGGRSFWSKYTSFIISYPSEHLYIAQVDEAIVGYALFSKSGNTAYCPFYAVANDFKRMGIATKLALKIFDEDVNSFSCHIFSDNVASQAVIKKIGRDPQFEVEETIGCSQNYYKVYKK